MNFLHSKSRNKNYELRSENKTTTNVSKDELPSSTNENMQSLQLSRHIKPNAPSNDGTNFTGPIKGGFRNSRHARILNNPNVDVHAAAQVYKSY